MRLLRTLVLVALVTYPVQAQNRELAQLAETNQRAAAAQNAGNYVEAERLHRAVVDGAARVPGFPGNEMARALSNLASVLNLQNRSTEALPLLQRALELLQRQPSADPAQYATLHGNLGNAYSQQANWAAAEKEFNVGLDVLKSAGVTDRAHLFEFDHSLGYVYWKTGRLADARARYEAALTTVRAFAPATHPVRVKWEREYEALLTESRR